jgi:hypothetical protein
VPSIFAPVEHRDERIMVETDRYRVIGTVSIPREGQRSRLSDFLNSAELGFLSLTDVEVSPLDDPRPADRRAFMALSVDHIVLAMPAEPEAQPGGRDGAG